MRAYAVFLCYVTATKALMVPQRRNTIVRVTMGVRAFLGSNDTRRQDAVPPLGMTQGPQQQEKSRLVLVEQLQQEISADVQQRDQLRRQLEQEAQAFETDFQQKRSMLEKQLYDELQAQATELKKELERDKARREQDVTQQLKEQVRVFQQDFANKRADLMTLDSDINNKIKRLQRLRKGGAAFNGEESVSSLQASASLVAAPVVLFVATLTSARALLSKRAAVALEEEQRRVEEERAAASAAEQELQERNFRRKIVMSLLVGGLGLGMASLAFWISSVFVPSTSVDSESSAVASFGNEQVTVVVPKSTDPPPPPGIEPVPIDRPDSPNEPTVQQETTTSVEHAHVKVAVPDLQVVDQKTDDLAAGPAQKERDIVAPREKSSLEFSPSLLRVAGASTLAALFAVLSSIFGGGNKTKEAPGDLGPQAGKQKEKVSTTPSFESVLGTDMNSGSAATHDKSKLKSSSGFPPTISSNTTVASPTESTYAKKEPPFSEDTMSPETPDFVADLEQAKDSPTTVVTDTEKGSTESKFAKEPDTATRSEKLENSKVTTNNQHETKEKPNPPSIKRTSFETEQVPVVVETPSPPASTETNSIDTSTEDTSCQSRDSDDEKPSSVESGSQKQQEFKPNMTEQTAATQIEMAVSNELASRTTKSSGTETKVDVTKQLPKNKAIVGEEPVTEPSETQPPRSSSVQSVSTTTPIDNDDEDNDIERAVNKRQSRARPPAQGFGKPIKPKEK